MGEGLAIAAKASIADGFTTIKSAFRSWKSGRNYEGKRGIAMNQQGSRSRMRKVVIGAFFAVMVFTGELLPAAQIALLDSARARTYFGLHYGYCVLNSTDPNAIGAESYSQYFKGWQEVLEQMKKEDPANPTLAYDIVSDDFIANGLVRSNYKLLILSNNVGLVPAHTDAIRQWVGNGGRLLATFGTGYEAVLDDSSQVNSIKSLKNSLQQLWGDPLSKAVTTATLGLVPPVEGSYPPGSVEPMITRAEGPNAKICQFYIPGTNTCPPYFPALRLVLGYGDLANMLIGRSENHPGAYAHFAFANNLAVYDPNNLWPDTQYSKPLPAVVASTYKRGWTVYYAFAPEFIVALEYDSAGHCATDPNYPGEHPDPGLQSPLTWVNNRWAGRTPELRALMKSAIDWLLKVQ